MEVVDLLLDPAHGYYKIRNDIGDVYIPRHDSPTDCWELILFARGDNSSCQAGVFSAREPARSAAVKNRDKIIW